MKYTHCILIVVCCFLSFLVNATKKKKKLQNSKFIYNVNNNWDTRIGTVNC